MNEFEVVLPRRVLSQPVPFLHGSGDCGACCVGALVGMDVPSVYATFRKNGSFGTREIRDALVQAEDQDLLDRIIVTMPSFRAPETWGRIWGDSGASVWRDWFAYLTMALDGGYYALAPVDSRREGEGPSPGADHIVLLVGVRVRREPLPSGGARIRHEVLVSCSSTSTPAEEWVGAFTFLSQRGGFNLMLARPVSTVASCHSG